MANPDLPAPIDYPDKVNVRPTTNHVTEFWAQDANLIKSVVNQIIDAINLIEPGDLIGITQTAEEYEFDRGIYADTVRTLSGTVQIGPQLKLKDGGGNLLLVRDFDAQTSIPVVVVFDDAGSVGKAFVSQFAPKEPNVVFQPDESEQMNQSKYIIAHPATTNAFVTKYFFKFGNGVPDSLNLKIYNNSETQSQLLGEVSLDGPFTPNSEIEIELLSPVGFYQGQNSIIVLESDTIFNLKSNSAKTEPYWAVERQTADFYTLLDERDTTYANAYIGPDHIQSIGVTPEKVNFTFLDSAKNMTVSNSRVASNQEKTKAMLITLSASLLSGKTNTVITLSVYKNGVMIPGATSDRKFATTTDAGSMSINTIAQLSENDYIEVFAHVDSATSFTFKSVQLSVYGV